MILYRFTVLLFTFLWISGFLSLLPAAEMTSQIDLFHQESQKFMIRGVYYLINQNNPEAAEGAFRQAIVLDQHNGEAYYFLGRIYYEQATSTGNLSVSQLQQFIGQSKALLLRAQELGVTYDKLHPNLLSRLKREYPKVAPIYEEALFPKKANIIIETESPTFDIRASKTNPQNTSVIIGNFLPEEEISIEGDASYQLEFLPKKPRSIKHLILVGIGLTIWLIR